MATASDEEYEIPLKDQRFFGAGIKRKRIKFVSATSNEPASQSLPTTPSISAADKYLSIVLKKSAPAERAVSAPPIDGDDHTPNQENPSDEPEDLVRSERLHQTCDICGRLIANGDSAIPHESSIAHQICLQHSHPPSHLDRRRKGLTVLESQGWDPDSRRGLGVEGEGILHPIKAKENPQRAGLGVKLADLNSDRVRKPTGLDAGKVRQIEKDGKKKAERLRNAFYRSDDMERYLGDEGEVNETLDLDAFKRARRR